jgi:riboflavin kinase/FMN adenylyltransferase
MAYLTERTSPGIPEGVKTIYGQHRLESDLGRRLRSPAVAIGNFDGVHLGHQALLQTAAQAAQAMQGETVALTFDPHPARFFAPSLAPPMLTTLSRRAELLGESGADIVVIEPFTANLAKQSAQTFVAKTLVEDLGVRHVVVGADFSFGQGRQGNSTTLGRICGELGVGVSIVPQVTQNGLVCSSTKIREFVLEGRVEGAHMLLGRPFAMEGTVVKGFQRGRTLGFPTANLQAEGEIAPKPGVYAGKVIFLDASHAPQTAAISIGNNPTFAGQGDPELLIEAHLLDFSGDLYAARLRFTFLYRLRDQRRFDSVDALIVAIRNDIVRTREMIP